MFGYTLVKRRYSAAVEFAAVDVLRARAIVRFKESGDEYVYTNVSRRKLINLLINDNMSLGFWVQQLRKDAINVTQVHPLRNQLRYERVGNSLNSNALPACI